MLKGSKETTGCTTSGGSESIFMGILAHKRYFFTNHGITQPNMVFPETAHPAFRKACEYLDINQIILDVDKNTGMLKNSNDYERYLNKNTICLVGSCPNLPYGTIDPLKKIG